MNTRYDVLLCDADNTIFDFNKAEENAFELTCAYMQLKFISSKTIVRMITFYTQLIKHRYYSIVSKFS